MGLCVQFSLSVMSDSFWPHGLQPARPPCPSPTPGVYPKSCPLSQRCPSKLPTQKASLITMTLPLTVTWEHPDQGQSGTTDENQSQNFMTIFLTLRKRNFWTVVLEETLESPLDCKEIQPVHPKGKSVLNIHWKDWYWSWNSSTLDTWCEELTHWKRPWCWEKLKAREEKGTTEYEMVGWHHWHDGHEFE